MDRLKRLFRKIKSGVRYIVDKNIELAERLFGSYDKKIVIGTFILFIGAGLVTAGLVEKSLIY